MKPEDQCLTGAQIEGFVKLLGLTRAREFDCGECLEHVGEFAEAQLAGRPLDDALTHVEHHLSVCPECREEWLALMKILEAGE
jgi:hypothetical protein